MLLLLLLAAGHGLAWYGLVLRLEDGVAAWAVQRRAEGWTVQHGAAVRGGWPLTARLTLADVELRHGALGWRAEHVALTLAPRSLERLGLAATGRQVLETAGQAIPVSAERLAINLPLAPEAYAISGLPRDVSLAAGRLRLDLPGGPLEVEALRLDLAAGDGAGPADPLVRVSGSAARLVLPPAVTAMAGVAVLGSSLDRIVLDLMLAGPWPGGAGTPAVRAARWRDGGGTLEVRDLGLGWGAARLGTTALLSLDATLQPTGEGLVRLSGATSVLQAAQAAGMIGRREVTAAQMLLTLLQRTPPEGGPPRLEVPALLERRSLSLGGLTLLRLPALPWAGPPR